MNVRIRDKEVQELKGMFPEHARNTVSLEDMHAAAKMPVWNNVVPVGREFGSLDYDRLTELDSLAFKALGNLLKARLWLETPD